MFYRKYGKRMFDCFASLLGIFFLWPLIFFGWVLACISTRSNGLFVQTRVGSNGKLFRVYKLKTMCDVQKTASSVTALNINRITQTGNLLRKLKLDELPQLFNVFLGDMSFVGPRPDVPGYTDILSGKFIPVREATPGITGYATIFFKFEEEILSEVENPQEFNDRVIFPLKSCLNLRYLENYTFTSDLKVILATIFSIKGFRVKPLRHSQECIDLLEELSC